MSRPARVFPTYPDGTVIPATSASLLLVQPVARTASGFDYRLLLLKRNGSSSTFAAAAVFPGGNRDDGDAVELWRHLFTIPQEPGAQEDMVNRMTAIRETFEESGILVLEGSTASWDRMDDTARQGWRDRVHHDGKTFVELFRFLAEGTPKGEPAPRPALARLQYRANWVTPKPMKRRFDTKFYITILPSSSGKGSTLHETIASADNKETVSADWLTPAEAVGLTMVHTKVLLGGEPKGEKSIILYPPQFYLLAELVHTKSWRDLLPPDADPNLFPLVAPRQVLSFIPEMKPVKTPSGATRPATVLPGDAEHSSTPPEARGGAGRHRTYVIMPRKVEGEKMAPGLNVIGLHRSGMESLYGKGWEDMSAGDIGADEKAKL